MGGCRETKTPVSVDDIRRKVNEAETMTRQPSPELPPWCVRPEILNAGVASLLTEALYADGRLAWGRPLASAVTASAATAAAAQVR